MARMQGNEHNRSIIHANGAILAWGIGYKNFPSQLFHMLADGKIKKDDLMDWHYILRNVFRPDLANGF